MTVRVGVVVAHDGPGAARTRVGTQTTGVFPC